MEIRYRLSPADLTATRAHVQARLREVMLRRVFWRALLAGAFIGVLLLVRHGYYSHTAGLLAAGALLALALLGVARDWPYLAARRVARQTGEHALKMSSEGISWHAPDGRVGFYPWARIRALETTDAYVYFFLRHDTVIAAPCADAAGEAVRAFAAEARRLYEAHPGRAGQSLPAAPAIPEALLSRLWANLREAARLVCFLKFEPGAFRVSWGILAWLLLADYLLGAMHDYVLAQPLPLFNWTGLGADSLDVLVFLGWAVAVSWLLAQRASLLRLLVMAQSAFLLISLALFAVNLALEQRLADAMFAQLGVYLAGLLLMVAALVRIIRRLYQKGAFAALFMGGAYVLFSVTLYALFPAENGIYVNAAQMLPMGEDARETAPAAAKRPAAAGETDAQSEDAGKESDQTANADVDNADDGQAGDGEDDGWADDEEDDEDDDEQFTHARTGRAKIDVEDVYYRQPEMVRRALDGVKPRRAGETGLYFVGFAGDGSEHEFANEVRYARGLLDRRFNTRGRSLMLINSYESVHDTPLANAHNMESILQGLASRMDRKNDVLFLFLSSHGAQDHRLMVSLDPLEMNDLKAEKLKELLDKSGIRNRVIVVSACYSGGFLDVLKDDNTLILTASSRDHVAYGCGDTSEYTYFGEAYFVKSLAGKDSFITAFDQARGLIEAREKRSGQSASRPQIHVGHNIGKVLSRLKVLPAKEDAHTCGLGCGKKKPVD